MRRSPTRRVLVLLVGAFLGAAATVYVPRHVTARHSEIMGCETGCRVAAAGWPIPFVVDYPAISPVGSVSLSGALLGVDLLRWGAFAATYTCWLALGAGVMTARRRWKSTTRSRDGRVLNL